MWTEKKKTDLNLLQNTEPQTTETEPFYQLSAPGS